MRATRSKTVVILLNGTLSARSPALRPATTGARVICADGGARHAARHGIEPHVVIGDMDSLPRKLPRWKNTVYLCDFDPDRSDFEKALRLLARSGPPRRGRLGDAGRPDRVVVAGALGGRLDHTLVNLALVESYSKRLPLVLLDGEEAADREASILGPGRHTVRCRPGSRVSLLPATPLARVSAVGLLYPLKRLVLKRGSRGLGNRAVSGRLRLKVHSGRLWVLLASVR